MERSYTLYHGSAIRIEGALKPVLRHGTIDHVHTKPAVFATARKDLAALFMFPNDTLASIGFERDVAYICVWGTPEEFHPKDKGGFIYILSAASFEGVGKEYERQSFVEVMPQSCEEYASVIQGMMLNRVQVYFINDDATFDRIVAEKNTRAAILGERVSENQRLGLNVREFPE